MASTTRTETRSRSRTRRPSPPAHLQKRLRALQERLHSQDCPALLVTNPTDIRFLTGFIGDDSWAVIPARAGQVYILSDFRFQEQIPQQAPHVSPLIRKGPIEDELVKLFKRLKLSRIGLQAEYVTLGQRKRLVGALGASKLKELDDGLLAQRAIKDPDEIRLIRRAGALQQEAFRQVIGQLHAGQSEHEIAGLLEFHLRRLGADGVSFPTIVAIDANAALPHAIPGRARLKSGSMVLIDWGARLDGYCSDMTRVLALDKMKPRIQEVYKVCLAAQQAAIEAVEPGRPLIEVDKAARQVIEKAGFGDFFGHGTGHGLGLDIHERPTLSPRSEGELEPGHVVTIEPGIYLPGVGGVRIEDDVLVTPRGRQVLTDLPKGLESTII